MHLELLVTPPLLLLSLLLPPPPAAAAYCSSRCCSCSRSPRPLYLLWLFAYRCISVLESFLARISFSI
jgi:hypothetical protein